MNKCYVCDQEFAISPDTLQSGCPRCAWPSLIVPSALQHPDFLTDQTEQVHLRKDFIPNFDKEQLEARKLYLENQKMKLRLIEISEQVALLQTENTRMEAEINKVEADNAATREILDQSLFDEKIEHSPDNHATVKECLEKDHLRIEGYLDAKKGLLIRCNHQPQDPCMLALGFSRKLRHRIDETDIIYRIRLHKHDFERFVRSHKPVFEACPEVEIRLTGKWYVMLTPFQRRHSEGSPKLYVRMDTHQVNFL